MVGDEAKDETRPHASKLLADKIRAEIEAGEYPVDSSLPTYRKLASDHDVAVNTAIAAVRLLRDWGLVTIRKNAGAKVRDRSSDVDVAGELRTIRDEMASLRSDITHAGSRLADLEQRVADLADTADRDQLDT